ncbi:hypothetical protein [Bacteroides acidifaciens]|uniref:hypothetical protein n=1 Tax=Bacteroides acidifaciens TaxID=85831 RepID=UPI00263AA60F|nr:hypothetical protein [Bacteroides acidifaciens]
MNILKGDIVKIYGNKGKLKIMDDQIGPVHRGINAKGKSIRFTDEQISKITRDGGVVYSNVGTGE